MSNFRVGQKVVCIADDWEEIVIDSVNPTVGDVYTVRSIEAENYGTYLRFEEITNKAFRFRDLVMEMSFEAGAFRPLVTRKTDISIFKAMLNPSKQGVPA